MLELITKVININLPENHPILEKCRPLYEYSWFIQKIKEYLDMGNDRDAAILTAIKDCLNDGIMEEFLAEHGTEAINMLFTEFNMEDALEVRYEEGIEKGEQKMTQLIQKLIEHSRSDEIAKMANDKEFQKQLFDEFGL